MDFIVFLLQLLAVTVYLCVVIFFTFGMLHAHFRKMGDSFGAPHPEVLKAIEELKGKLDAALSAND